jgi:hypothetical protein
MTRRKFFGISLAIFVLLVPESQRPPVNRHAARPRRYFIFLSPHELGFMIDSFIIAGAQRCAGSAGIFEQVAAVSCEMPRSASFERAGRRTRPIGVG